MKKILFLSLIFINLNVKSSFRQGDPGCKNNSSCPPGGYLTTCIGCKCSNNTNTLNCSYCIKKDKTFKYNYPTISYSGICSSQSDIYNDNGNLKSKILELQKCQQPLSSELAKQLHLSDEQKSKSFCDLVLDLTAETVDFVEKLRKADENCFHICFEHRDKLMTECIDNSGSWNDTTNTCFTYEQCNIPLSTELANKAGLTDDQKSKKFCDLILDTNTKSKVLNAIKGDIDREQCHMTCLQHQMIKCRQNGGRWDSYKRVCKCPQNKDRWNWNTNSCEPVN